MEVNALRDLHGEDSHARAMQHGRVHDEISPPSPRAAVPDSPHPIPQPPAPAPGSSLGRSESTGCRRSSSANWTRSPEAQGQPRPTSTAHHGVCDLEDQRPGCVVGKAGGVEEVAGGPEVNHAVVIWGQGQRQRREGGGGAVGQGEEFALGGGKEVKQESRGCWKSPADQSCQTAFAGGAWPWLPTRVPRQHHPTPAFPGQPLTFRSTSRDWAVAAGGATKE